MDGVILFLYVRSHFGCIRTESFWLYTDGVILVVYGWSHFGCIWMEYTTKMSPSIYNQNDSVHIQSK